MLQNTYSARHPKARNLLRTPMPSKPPLLSAPIPLANPDWKYVRKREIDQYRAADWEIWHRQRTAYYQDHMVDQILRMLACQKHDLGYIYTVNNYYHCLQTATRMLRAGLSDEDVVVGLLHDVGFITCNETHGEFAAALLRPYISERNYWMLTRHAIFQQYHFHELEGCNRHERDQWQGHPYFAWTAEFVDQYDQRTISFDEEILPIEAFEPAVRRVFAKPLMSVTYT
jgi:predicted HD phosphohydrolase